MDSVYPPPNIVMETRSVLMAVMNSTVVSSNLLATFLYLSSSFGRKSSCYSGSHPTRFVFQLSIINGGVAIDAMIINV